MNRIFYISILLILSTNILSEEIQNILTPSSFSFQNHEKQKIIEDATCNVEQVEEANDSQLYSITHELKKTLFFRTFAVDLDHGCPLTGWKRLPKNNEKNEDGEEQCTCGIDSATSGGADDDIPIWEKEKPFEMPMSKLEDEPNEEVNDYDDDFDDETFECGGNKEEDDDLESDGEPLCSVEGESFSSLAKKSLSPVKDLFSSALQTLSEKFTWDSESQRKTFSWFTPSDPVILKNDETSSDCADDVPDTFWMDMCSEIKAGDGLQFVNLDLNPERNTGYNGTHIWKTIYEENCVLIDKQNAEMCYEERVLYKLLSGLHASTTLSIATNYYPPSKRKNRISWEPNPTYFYEKFEHHPEYIRNLHFSYLVMLRALRKAKGFLYSYEIRTGDILEDEKATVLLRRLLDSHILQSCSDVFDAFDENLMFNSTDLVETEGTILRQNFKGVFHNISSILDCVQCQQCKLHGKMAMLGYGTALKILFSKPEMISTQTIDRNEVVAFINTICKFSESLKEIRLLTNLYWMDNHEEKSILNEPVSILHNAQDRLLNALNEKSTSDKAVSVIVELSKLDMISMEEEIYLVQLALENDSNLLILVKYYYNDLERLVLHLRNNVLKNKKGEKQPDAIVIGSGLAGLVTAVQILDRGGQVILIDKEHTMGGNSAKASSGINGCCLPSDKEYNDTTETFKSDTTKSAGSSAQPALIDTLVQNSARALTYLSNRIGIDLSLVAQLGGHTKRRTHRPNNGMVGAEVIYGMTRVIKDYEKKGRVTILLDSKVVQLLEEDGVVTGVKYQNLNNETFEISSGHTILATGGFANARSSQSLLMKYRPEYAGIPATAGQFSTGDGITLANVLNANTIDMEYIQIHPTGWIDPNNEDSHSKILAAELLRGVGGILLSQTGKRFCNEVGTRAYVSDQMLIQSEPKYESTKQWDVSYELSSFYLLLSESAAHAAKKHVDLYTYKGLMSRIVGLENLAAFMNADVDTIRQTFVDYQNDANSGYDAFGKTTFNNIPGLDDEVYYVGRVTPVLHYCMGGLQITAQGQVLNVTNHTIPGLYAVGEVSGGVHGVNRLAGNSLLECTVFGMIVGESIPITTPSSLPIKPTTKEKTVTTLPALTLEELSKHNSMEDCWVSIHNKIYNLTEFALEHPPGPGSIWEVGGVDATDAFETVHNVGLLDDFDDVLVGTLV